MERVSLVRMMWRAFLGLSIAGALVVTAGLATGSRPVAVVGGGVLAMAAVPLAMLGLLYLERIESLLAAAAARRRERRALDRLDALEDAGSDDEFAEVCAHVRERIGSYGLDDRLRDRGRRARARYLPHATLGAVQSVAGSADDPLAAEARAEASRRIQTGRERV